VLSDNVLFDLPVGAVLGGCFEACGFGFVGFDESDVWVIFGLEVFDPGAVPRASAYEQGAFWRV
jgi:hypothetical protein